VVGDAPGVDVLNFQGSKGNNCVTSDGSCPNLNAMHGHDVHVVALDGDKLKPREEAFGGVGEPDGCEPAVARTLERRYDSSPCIDRGQNVIALDGDKLKPREDRRKGGNGFGINEEGAAYTLTAVDRHGVAYCADGREVASTITRQISEQSGQDNRANAVVQCYDMTHADDPGRKVADGVSPTLQSRMGTGGNQVPLTVSMAQNTRDEVRIIGGDGQIAGALPAEPGMKQQTYIVSTPGLDGYNKTLTGDCAPTISGAACDLHHTHGVISTNSNGGDVAPTILSCEYKMGQKQKDTRGGVCRDTEPLGIGRDVFNSGANASFSPDIRVGVQPTLTARTTQGAVCARLKGDE
jgi:hypothetical protein